MRCVANNQHAPRYVCCMMQLSEGFDKGAAVFNHWKVHNGRDADHLVRADSTGAKSNDGGVSDYHGDSDV